MDCRLGKRERGIIFIFSLFYVWYSVTTMIELPHMTWFDQIPLADLFYTGNLKITDMFSRYGEHGMLATNVLWLINVVMFRGSTLFDVWLNIANVIFVGVIITSCTYHSFEKRGKYDFCWVVAEAIFLFCCMQGSSGGMETQVRLGMLFSVITMVYISDEIQEERITDKSHFGFTVFLMILSVNVFGTLYTFAGVPLVWIILIVKMMTNRRIVKKYISIIVIYFGTIILYIFEYHLFDILGSGDSKTASMMENFIHMLAHPIETIKCIFSWCANGVFGWAVHESKIFTSALWLIVGAIVFTLIIVGVILFFKCKLYYKTWVPLMLIVYSFGVLVMVYLGRAGGWDWFANEWYNVHIKIALVGTIWVYAYATTKYSRFLLFGVGSTVIICLFGCVGNYFGIMRAPALHNYYFEKQKYLYVDNANDMPVDEISGNTPLLHSLDKTMEGIEILRKYNLSVYRYWNAYEQCPSTLPSRNSIIYLSGRYDDGWVEENCKISLYTAESTQLEFLCFATKKQSLRVEINGECIKENITLEEGKSSFTVPCEMNEFITIELNSDFSEQLRAPDIRVCSYILEEIKRN